MDVLKEKSDPPIPKLVFEDRTGKRRRIVLALVTTILLLVLGFAAEFSYRVFNLKAPLVETSVFDPFATEDNLVFPNPDSISIVMKDSAYTDCGQGWLNLADAPSGVAGYVPFNDVTAMAGLRAHCADLDTVYYQAFSFGDADGSILALGPIGAAFPLEEFNTGFASRNRPTAFPVLSPKPGTTEETLVQIFEALGPAKTFGDDLRAIDLTGVDGGVCIDMTHFPDIPTAALISVFETLNDWLSPQSLGSCLIGNIDAAFWQDPVLVDLIGQTMLLGFQETKNPSSPVARQVWFDDAAQTTLGNIDSEKTSVALGSFSTLWKSGQRQSIEIPYSEAMLRASFFDGALLFSEETGNTNARYIDENRRLNQIWMLDAVSFHNQRLAIGDAPQITIWPIGYEDPAVWHLLESGQSQNEVAEALEAEIDLSDHMTAEGAGPFSTHIAHSSIGLRHVEFSPENARIISQSYSQIPSPRRVQLFGDSDSFELALAFNGLGSTRQTDILLELLARYNISATFFLSTRELLLAEVAVNKLVEQGHTIGTKTTPRESRSRTLSIASTIQNNLTQQLLQDNFGHHALFVQSPTRYGQFAGDHAVLDQLQDLQSSGYFPVYSNIAAPYGPFDPLEFVSDLSRKALLSPANVLNFDFSEQNDATTNRLLPDVLGKLVNDGFTFTTLPEIAGLETAQVFPVSTTSPARRDQTIYWFLTISWLSVQGYIFLLALMVALQSPIYLLLAFLRREKYPMDDEYRPPVTVIIPAYNEAKVIRKTLKSVLASDYPNLKVIVVDDGSKDETAAVVEEMVQVDRRVKLIRQRNHGKWFAEDRALDFVETPYFVIVDADTLLQKDAIKYLVQPFRNEKVGAVAGTVEIGNRDNILTACQVIEYKISQIIVRRAYEVFNGILVVPGAIGAWRTEAVIKSGLVSGDTITEDADLTLAVHRSDYKVIYAPKAKSYTEAPNSVRSFMQQRLRWSLGMLQVSWKHRGAVMEGRPVGFISIVNAIWYRTISSFIYPLVDIIIAYSIVLWGYTLATQGVSGLGPISLGFMLLFLLLTFLDAINLLASFLLERRFNWKLLLLVPFLRFGYWQLIYISSLRSIFHAISGRLRGWQKLQRTDTARILEKQ